jgi:hypothetical protein
VLRHPFACVGLRTGVIDLNRRVDHAVVTYVFARGLDTPLRYCRGDSTPPIAGMDFQTAQVSQFAQLAFDIPFAEAHAPVCDNALVIGRFCHDSEGGWMQCHNRFVCIVGKDRMDADVPGIRRFFAEFDQRRAVGRAHFAQRE